MNLKYKNNIINHVDKKNPNRPLHIWKQNKVINGIKKRPLLAQTGSGFGDGEDAIQDPKKSISGE